MRLTYVPWKRFFTVFVRHAASQKRNSVGADSHYFWTPWCAILFAKREVAKETNAHASIYFRLWYRMSGKVVCRVTKNGIIREFPERS